MNIYQELLNNFSSLKEKADKEKNHYLFWNNGIFLTKDKSSDARYPYVKDGMVLWAHNNGKIHLSESDFFFLPETVEGETSFLSFFLGIKKKDSYLPVSLFEFDRNVLEEDVERATFFSYHSATYILHTSGIFFFVTLTLNEKKELLLYGKVINDTNEEKDIYTSLYFNPMLMHNNYSSVETKWFKKCHIENDCFQFDTTEDISREIHLYHHYSFKRNTVNVEKTKDTTSRLVYSNSKTGNKNASECLLKGEFFEEKKTTCFSDTAIAGDFLKSHLCEKESFSFSYQLTKSDEFMSLNEIEDYFISISNDEDVYNIFSFDKGSIIDSEKFTDFSKMLVKQVDYCAGTKNSTLRMLGFRDIFQALEAAVIFKPEMVREKILGCLDYVSTTGRCPRQFAWSEGKNVRIDSREFIDQGLWVIDCIYQYLSYTDDYSLLSEKRRYIEIHDDSSACFSDRTDNVLSHLKQMLSYLIDNIDADTGCLKTLYGDWNDAIDGLGKTENGIGFGNGVSIMATFQLYSALNKSIEIFNKIGEQEDWIAKAENAKSLIEEGLLHHAFVTKGKETKIIHGWGNNRSFYVGSFKDIDQKERDTLTSNAFYVLSGFYRSHPEYTNAVFTAYEKLEGKYGFKTFEPYFDKDAYQVGRIVNLPKGTAENAATYIHGSVFALDSLFLLNKPKMAWDEIEKLIPITHEFISTTPFVMPNSYVYNPELGCDGESMNDWFTGSSSTLFKSLVRNAFGFDPHLNQLVLHPADYFPFEEADMTITFRNKLIHLHHIQKGKERHILLNGKKLNLMDEENGLRKKITTIPYTDLEEENTILISD